MSFGTHLLKLDSESEIHEDDHPGALGFIRRAFEGKKAAEEGALFVKSLPLVSVLLGTKLKVSATQKRKGEKRTGTR